jgi:hypothetical protein
MSTSDTKSHYVFRDERVQQHFAATCYDARTAERKPRQVRQAFITRVAPCEVQDRGAVASNMSNCLLKTCAQKGKGINQCFHAAVCVNGRRKLALCYSRIIVRCVEAHT